MLEEEITLIYLVENCYGDPNKVYIGKNRKGAETRKYKHTYTYGKDINYTYIDEINSWLRKDWKPLECYWIEQFRQWGFEVQNKNPGGGGTIKQSSETCLKKSKSMMGHIISDETRERMSRAKKGKFISPMIGKKQSQETIDKRVSKTRGLVRTEELKERMRIISTGRKMSKLSKDKIGEKNSKIVIQKTLQDKFVKEWNSLTKAAEFVKVNISCITDCCRGKQKTSAGFKWKYKN